MQFIRRLHRVWFCKIWHQVLLIGWCLTLVWGIQTSSVRAESLVQVVDAAWASGVTEMKTPIQRYTTDIAPKDKALYFWMTIRGGYPALEHLKQKGKITLIHKWEYNHFGWKTERMNVSIGRDVALDENILQKLKYELDAKGYFDWRTWSKKAHVAPITYSVTVVDGFNDPIECQPATLCDMKITLRP